MQRVRGKDCWLEAIVSDVEVAEELAEYMVYYCAVRDHGNEHVGICKCLSRRAVVGRGWSSGG